MSVTDLNEAREALGAGDGNFPPEHPEPDPEPESSRSIAERAIDPVQVELFPAGTIAGDGKTLKTLIRANQAQEITTSMMSAEVPTPRGGLLDPERQGMLLVTYDWRSVPPVAVREGEPGDRRIVSWKLRQQVRPVHIEQVHGEAGVIEANFAALLEADPEAARDLFARLGERLG